MKFFQQMAALVGPKNTPVNRLQNRSFKAVNQLEVYLGTGTETPPEDQDPTPEPNSIFEDQVML